MNSSHVFGCSANSLGFVQFPKCPLKTVTPERAAVMVLSGLLQTHMSLQNAGAHH